MRPSAARSLLRRQRRRRRRDAASAPASARRLPSRVHGSVEYSLTRATVSSRRQPRLSCCCSRRRRGRRGAGTDSRRRDLDRDRRARNRDPRPRALPRQQRVRAPDRDHRGPDAGARLAIRRAGAAVAAVHGLQQRQVGDAASRSATSSARPPADQSVYDELLVVRPPKRIVGGVTLQVLDGASGRALRNRSIILKSALRIVGVRLSLSHRFEREIVCFSVV